MRLSPGVRSRLRSALIGLGAALSGGATLSYELTWSRALVVPLGNSSDATAVVLAAFMLGLALGAGLGGARAERVRSPLGTYAVIEFGLAAVASLLPAALGSLQMLPIAGRYLGALLLVAVPSLAMGATFPLLVRALAADGGELRRRVGVVYGANTLGAAVGACLTGFLGIAALGITGSSLAGAFAGVAAGMLALGAAALGFDAPGAAPAREDEPLAELAGGGAPAVTAEARFGYLPRFAPIAVAALGGFVMLAAEVAWARVLTFVFGHDTYAFASLLAVVLVGLAGGGFAHRALARVPDRTVLGTLAALLGLTLGASYWGAAALVIARGRDPLGLDATQRWATSAWLELGRELVLTPILVLAPALAAGALLPAACAAHARGRADPGRRTGAVVLVNGLGSVLGAVVGALCLGSVVGIHEAFRLLATLGVAGGAAVLLVSAARPLERVAAFAPLALLAALLAALPPSLPEHLLLAAVGPRHQRLLHYEEGRTATISVIRNELNGEKQLLVNAVNEVTTRLVHDQSFALLGHLGPLLHPDPRRAVMICLGAGLSAGAAATHPLERLDVVDLSAAVPRGARHFAVENGGVLDAPVFHLFTDDGRRFLLDARQPYDLAIVDSTHPKAVDSWILYTRDFYALVRERLAPGGIVVQWLPLHGLSEREFYSVVRTFLAVFPEGTLWANVGFETYGQVGYAKLVARRDGPLELDLDRIEARLAEPAVRDSLRPFGNETTAELLAAYVGGPAELAVPTAGLPVQTDDHPIVAYTTRWSRGRRMVPRLLLPARGSLEDRLTGSAAARGRLGAGLVRVREAEAFVLAGRLDRARELAPGSRRLALYAAQAATTEPYYAALARRYADVPAVLHEAATQLGTLGHAAPALEILTTARALAPEDFRIALHHALALRAVGDEDGALRELEALRRRSWDAALVHQNLGAMLLDAGEPGVAVSHLESALALEPTSPGVALALAQARLAAGDGAGALRTALALVAAEPTLAEAHQLQAQALILTGDCPAGAASASRAVALDPTAAAAQRTRAEALECAGERRAAEAAWAAALHAEPEDARAHDGLGSALVARGELEAGLVHLVSALELEPGSGEFALHLGLALGAAGRIEDAVVTLCLARRLEPGLAAAGRELAALAPGRDPCRAPSPPAQPGARGDAGRPEDTSGR